MKTLIVFLGLWTFLPSFASAHIQGPITDYLQNTDRVCLAKVQGLSEKNVIFTTEDILRGKVDSTLSLNPYASGEKYTPGSEWLLVSNPHGFKDCVGWAMKGDCEWIPGTATRNGNQTYVTDWTSKIQRNDTHLFGIAWDTTPDGKRCLTWDHVKAILKDHPYKP